MVKKVGALRRAMEAENIIPANQSALDVLASAQPILATYGAFSSSSTDTFYAPAPPAEVCY